MSARSSSRNPIARMASSIKILQAQHAERHRPTGFQFAFANRVDFLHPQAWDSVAVHGGLFLRREILRVIERHGPDNITPRYALIFRGDKPVAAVAVQIVQVTGRQFRPPDKETHGRRPAKLLQHILKPAARIAAAKVRERLLVAGNLFSWGFDGMAFVPDEDGTLLWPAVAEALYRIRRAERLTGQTNFVMVKDLTEQQGSVEVLRRFSYRPLTTEPNMVLSIPESWRHYDDYLAALGAKYRRNALDQMKKLTAGGCVLERLTDTAAHRTRLHELYLAVQSHAAVRLVTLRDSFLPALAEAAGENFRCTVVRRNGELLGFVTTLRNGDTAIAYYIGFDRAAAAEGLPLYLRLLHATINDAIDWRCKQLSLGRTALEPKAALGARPEPMTVWLRHRVPALNWMLRGLLNTVTHAEAPERNPFKSMPGAQPAEPE
jgi:Acetyltransferase (GNAT) domain